MGAFGNYSYNPKPKIDFSKLNTVSVIVNFNAERKFVPIYFRYIYPDESEQTIKIDTIKFTKDKGDSISFRCLFTNHEMRQEVILTFYVAECVWIIE
jgi:hypothetical protein